MRQSFIDQDWTMRLGRSQKRCISFVQDCSLLNLGEYCLKIIPMTTSDTWPGIMTKWFTIQKINSKMCSAKTTSQDVTALIVIWKFEFRKSRIWKRKTLQLCPKGYIFKSYYCLAELAFKWVNNLLACRKLFKIVTFQKIHENWTRLFGSNFFCSNIGRSRGSPSRSFTSVRRGSNCFAGFK